MGIVNVTPDSFSDAGRYFSPDTAIDHGLRLADEGADILDIGGESTRPYASPIDAEEELRRVIPVVEELAKRCQKPISIDTSKAIVASEALDAGVEIVNDVTGLEGDPRMIELVAERGPGVCVMHMQGTPQTMQVQPTYTDVVAEIVEYLCRRRDVLIQHGVDPSRICVDPGIGFGKTHQHNLTLMAHCDAFHETGQPVLFGHSRKGFIGKVLGDNAADRTFGTVGAAMVLAQRGIQIIRVHDVRSVRESLSLFDACGGIDGHELQVS
jgi:dihydropteroate synthase